MFSTRCCDVDVHADVHANVHIPGQGIGTGPMMPAALSPYARAVQVGAAEASDVSGAEP
jgi:hypothetical protein